LRTVASAGVVPVIDVVALVRPSTTTTLDTAISGATAATPDSPAMAVASSTVRVLAEPAAPRIPPTSDPPALTERRFVPRPAIWLVIAVWVPSPTPMSATSDATPMMTPSVVSAVRSGLVRSRRRASRSASR
jgi:hypothetical protein